MKSATANHVVYLFVTKLRTTLRAVARLQPLVARKKEGEEWRFEVCNSEPCRLFIRNEVTNDIESSCQTSASRS
ncbi:hypothetical protein [Pilibacter termitis]|uniref:hypothetical protein n=1 Tax=Pilibacter termitis TaxID=263852 RepID=UPI0011847B1B|nr:hypothetical protein [Pilibacter termitis]